MQQSLRQSMTTVSGGSVNATNIGGWMQPVTAAGYPTIGYMTFQPLEPANDQPNVVVWFQSRQSVGLGTTLIVVGVLAMIFNVVALGVGDGLATVGHGLWCGAVFIITGGIGIEARKKTRCMAFMILCIFSSIFAICLFGFGVGGADDVTNYVNETGHAMEALQAILAAAAAIVSIWGSVICCNAVCMCAIAPPTYIVTTVPYGDQQVLVITKQQKLYEVQYLTAHMMTAP